MALKVEIRKRLRDFSLEAAFAAENGIWCITFPYELTEIEGYDVGREACV